MSERTAISIPFHFHLLVSSPLCSRVRATRACSPSVLAFSRLTEERPPGLPPPPTDPSVPHPVPIRLPFPFSRRFEPDRRPGSKGRRIRMGSRAVVRLPGRMGSPIHRCTGDPFVLSDGVAAWRGRTERGPNRVGRLEGPPASLPSRARRSRPREERRRSEAATVPSRSVHRRVGTFPSGDRVRPSDGKEGDAVQRRGGLPFSLRCIHRRRGG